MIVSHEGKMIVKMKGALFVRILMRLYGRQWMWLFLLFLTFGIVCSLIWDIRALLLSAMSVFILFPGAMLFLYYYYGLLSGCYSNFVWHSIALEGKEMVISYYYPDRSGNNKDEDKGEKFGGFDEWNRGDFVDEEEKLNKGEDRVSDFGGRLIKSGDIRYSTQRLNKYILIGNGVVFPFQGTEKGFLWLPNELCVSDNGEETIFDAILRDIRERI